MDVVEVLKQEKLKLEAKLHAIDRALDAIQGANGKRTMSEETRNKIRKAQLARWAQQPKAAAKKPTKK